MCVLTMPAGVAEPDAKEPVDKLPAADAVADASRDSDAATEECVVAAAKPIRADTMTDLEKYIFEVVWFFLSDCDWTNY